MCTVTRHSYFQVDSLAKDLPRRLAWKQQCIFFFTGVFEAATPVAGLAHNWGAAEVHVFHRMCRTELSRYVGFCRKKNKGTSSSSDRFSECPAMPGSQGPHSANVRAYGVESPLSQTLPVACTLVTPLILELHSVKVYITATNSGSHS